MPGKALTVTEIEEQLEKYLDPVLSLRRTAAEPAQSLAELHRPLQEFVLHWVSVVVKTNSEMGFQFAAYAARALQLMDREDVEAWLIDAMDTYDKLGLYPGCAAIQDVERYAESVADRNRTVSFEEVAGVLQRFVVGLSGRELTIAAASIASTDTEVLYLPDQISLFNDKHSNFTLYKSIVTFLWAQTRFGTFSRKAGVPSLSEVISGFADIDKAQHLFHALETIRLNAYIKHELPMMHREMFHIQNKVGEVRYPTDWRPVIEGLSVGPNSVEDTYRALAVVYPSTVQPPAPFCFQGELLIADAERCIKERQLREKMDLQNALGDIRRTMTTDAVGATPTSPLSMQIQSKPLASGEIGDLELTVNGRLVSLPEPANLVAQSIFQDFGEVPGEYLMPAGNSGYQAEESAKRAQDVFMGTHHEGGAYVYNEWDCRRRHYRKDWCVLRELEVHPLDTEFVTRTLSRYAHLITDLRKAFEALRGEDKLSKKQKHGNDVDIDAVVEAFADSAAGLEMSDHLFVKMNRLERDMAAVFMVDMSGSTKGWINEAEREALVLLCESLQVLGDRYAIYGFSGMTRKRCELYRVKSFDDAYDDQVKKRISGMKPQDYTRMGVTIRHLTWMLRNVDARTKLLITLSDGKPDDYDGYRGEYGIEDTRQALIEAKNEGIHPFCITIDSEAGEYLPHMYGAVNYVLVDEIRKLPLKVADIYRKLTT